MSDTENANPVIISFENEKEHIYFSFSLPEAGDERALKNTTLEDRFLCLIKQAYDTGTMTELLTGMKADSFESFITGVNFLIRYGICRVQEGQEDIMYEFYRSLEELFTIKENKYTPYAVYITEGLLAEEQGGGLPVKVPEEIKEKSSCIKKAWKEELVSDSDTKGKQERKNGKD